jgi:hypothetical protein
VQMPSQELCLSNSCRRLQSSHSHGCTYIFQHFVPATRFRAACERKSARWLNQEFSVFGIGRSAHSEERASGSFPPAYSPAAYPPRFRTLSRQEFTPGVDAECRCGLKLAAELADRRMRGERPRKLLLPFSRTTKRSDAESESERTGRLSSLSIGVFIAASTDSPTI